MWCLFPSIAAKRCTRNCGGHLGAVFRQLAKQKESQIEEGHLMSHHVHMMIAIPLKYAVSDVVRYIKGKITIHLARVYAGRKQNFVGQQFWARGFGRVHGGRYEAQCGSTFGNRKKTSD